MSGRWSHVPILDLFRQAGVSLTDKGKGKWSGGHDFKHGSKSGACLVVWEKDSRWWCSSCKARGDAADVMVDLGQAQDRADAEFQLAQQYGFTSAGRPAIQINNRPLDEITRESVQVLQKSNDPPMVFRRSGGLVRVRYDEKGRPIIDRMDSAILTNRLSQVARTIKVIKNKSGDLVDIDVAPPAELVRNLLSEERWPFVALDGITEIPVLRPDGSILVQPGYDLQTRLLYRPAPGLALPPIPQQPSRRQIASALALVQDVFDEFPFVNDASRANLILP